MEKKNLIIEKGDRVFARLIKDGRTVLEFMINCIGSVEELMKEIRCMAGEVHGLVKLCLRNQSRGWGDERLLMLCAGPRPSVSSPLSGLSKTQARVLMNRPSYARGNQP